MNAIFKSENLLFVKVDEKYVDDYLKMLNDEEIQRQISSKKMNITKESELDWIKSKLEKDDKIFTILEKNSKKFVGNIELKDYDGKTAELGIVITPQMQGKHYGPEAEKRMIEYAFNELGLEYLIAVVFDFNERSIHCAKKQGFTEIKRVPGSGDFGEYVDVYLKLENKVK